MSSQVSRSQHTRTQARLKARLGRLAASCAVAVLGAIALMNSCNGPVAVSIAWWLTYAVGAGLVLGTRRGEDLKAIGWLAVLPALTPMIALGFMFLSGIPVNDPGRAVCFSFHVSPALLPIYVVAFPVVSWLAIGLFSFGRDAASALTKAVLRASEDPQRVEKVATVVHSVAAALVAIVLVLASLGSSGAR